MELPFLKNKKKNQGGGGPIEHVSESSHPDHLLSSIAEELIDAYHRGDRRAFLEAFRAFAQLSREQDQDHE